MQNIDWQSTTAWVSSILCILGAIYALTQRVYRTQTTRLAIIYAILASLWALEQAIQPAYRLDFLDPGFVSRLPEYGLVVLAMIFLLLTRTILGAGNHRGLWLVGGLIWLAGIATIETRSLAIPDILYFQGGINLTLGSLITLLLIAEWAFFMGASASVTVHTLRHTSRYFTIVSYWVIVLLLVVSGSGLVFAAFTIPGLLLFTASILLTIFVVTAARLPEISNILRRWLNRLLYAGSALIIYTLVFTAAQLALRDQPGIQPVLVGLLLAVVFTALIDPLLSWLRKRIKRMVHGGPQDTTGMLRQFSQSITNILEMDRLATMVVGTIAELMDIKRGFLFVVEHEANEGEKAVFHVRGVKGMGDTNPPPGSIGEESPLVAYLRYEYKPLTMVDIETRERFRTLSPEEKAWLGRLAVDVLVPIYAKNEWIGLIALGAKANGSAYTMKELSLLSTIADQTAVALENTRLVEGLMRLNNDFRRAYSALDQANRNLERLDKTKSDFISIASHELRTPLTLISGTSQMLLDDPDLQNNAYYKQLLNKMHVGTVRLHEIVDAMLDVAKIDSRALELEPQPVSIDNLIQGVTNELKKDLNERKHLLEMNGLDTLPSITADAPALRKVFYHLIVNAIKYTPDNGKITITGSSLEPNATDLRFGGLEVIVCDTGIGIDPRFHELIFTKFYQTGELALHSSGKTKFKGGGPGLGLAIARGIVEAHRGRIWVESQGYNEENCPGSQFHVVLPLRSSDRPASNS